MANIKDNNGDGTKLHVAMFPWLAFGHLVPHLELSKLIVQKGHTVSFISTPRNIDRLLPRLPENLSSAINFVKLPFPGHNKLPEDAEATTDVPFDLIPYLKIAFDGLKTPVTEFLESSKPDWLLQDFVPYWLPPIANRLGIKNGYFSAFNCGSLGFFKPPGFEEYRTSPEDFLTTPKWVPFKTPVRFRLFEWESIKAKGVMVESVEGNIPDIDRIAGTIDGCDVIFVRSCYEYEAEWLELIQNLYRKPVIPVGVLPPKPEEEFKDTDTWLFIKKWLDSQKTNSVVYVGFGSEAKPSQTEINSIALGLELSGLPFFWVLKTRRGPWDTEPVELPEGFEERTAERGMVWRGWVEQLRTLSHDSIGLVLTHSGWSSIIEAIRFAKPMVVLAFVYDQGFYARVLEEKKFGYMIPRDETEGFFTKENVAKSLILVMEEEEEGKVYRENVKDMKGVFGDLDRQDRYVDSFLDYLVDHR